MSINMKKTAAIDEVLTEYQRVSNSKVSQASLALDCLNEAAKLMEEIKQYKMSAQVVALIKKMGK